jgi:hypothetical protein
MVQTYKKVLLLFMIFSFALTNASCNKGLLTLFHNNRVDQYSASKQFKPYHIGKPESTQKKRLNRIERKQNRKAQKAKRQALKAQEQGRKEHINKQKPDVQVRMKRSFEESEKTRKHKTFWERLMFWKGIKSKEKKL